MRYKASITDFFKTPEWRSNLLLGAVTLLIPLVGPVVLGGWHITCLWARGNREDLPAYDFQYFGKYLERGLWPFLVGLVTSLVLVPVMMVLMLVFFLMIPLTAPMNGGEPPAGILVPLFIGMVMLQMVLQGVYHVLVTPLMLRRRLHRISNPHLA
jgi:Protein of unknown function (DUF4013)